ncbi:thioesterase domain-containing protein [Streptomyces althioticus]|uniref:thioesterase domain-containing protein n=2 Tax=Streptomyces althioticus TaxID=83380 RepID=UPI00194011DE
MWCSANIVRVRQPTPRSAWRPIRRSRPTASAHRVNPGATVTATQLPSAPPALAVPFLHAEPMAARADPTRVRGNPAAPRPGTSVPARGPAAPCTGRVPAHPWPTSGPPRPAGLPHPKPMAPRADPMRGCGNPAAPHPGTSVPARGPVAPCTGRVPAHPWPTSGPPGSVGPPWCCSTRPPTAVCGPTPVSWRGGSTRRRGAAHGRPTSPGPWPAAPAAAGGAPPSSPATGTPSPPPCTASPGATRTPTSSPPTAPWVFSGYGSQWPGMGRELLAAEPAFAAAVERLDPDVPLTDLGLDSLTAVRIRTAVLGEFGSAPELGVLLRQGTLRGVAGLLDDAPAPSPLPPLAHPGEAVHGTPGVLRSFPGTGPHPPLFLAHAAGGSSDAYGHLAARLDGHRPVYGFDRLEHPDDVPSRAAEFARRIRQIRPEGPWAVGGWSYGGVVAQETARLLSREGEVTALVLVDSILPLPAPPVATPAEEARRRFVGFAAYVHTVYGAELNLPYAELGDMDDTAQVDLVLALLEKAVDLPPAVLTHQRSSYLDLRSAERHSPGPYPGRTLLYRATHPAPHTVRDARYERTDATLGWDAHCPDLTVTDLPAHHLALLDPPAVDALALDLIRALDPSGLAPNTAPMEP